MNKNDHILFLVALGQTVTAFLGESVDSVLQIRKGLDRCSVMGGAETPFELSGSDRGGAANSSAA